MAMDDELLAHHIGVVKYGANLGEQSTKYINEMRAIVRKRAAGFDSEKRTAKRLQALIEKLSKELAAPAGEWRKQLENELKTFARYEAGYQADTMADWLDVNFTTPSLESVWAAAQFQPMDTGANPVDFSKVMTDWDADEVARLAMGVKAGFVEGLSATQVIKNVVGAGGLSDISKRNAITNAQTMLMHVASEARMETYKANDDIVIGYVWVSTLDNRTSSICRGRDGLVVLNTNKVQPKPPAHYNCRSSTRPKLSAEFDIFSEGATRASKGADGGKQVDANKTYYDWLKDQPADYQDEALGGKTVGLIFRNSGLDAEEFRRISTDDLGRQVSLAGMAERDKRVKAYMKKAAPQYL